MNAGAKSDAGPEVGVPDNVREVWPLLLGIGIGLVVVGILAAGSAFVASLATERVFGIWVFLGSILQITNTVWAYRWKGFGLHLVVGVLYLIVGVFMIEHPGEATGLPLLVACCLLISGVLRTALSLVERFEGWEWTLCTGIGSFLLGVCLLVQWPLSGLRAIGLFVGIEMISSGVAWVLLGGGRHLPERHTRQPPPGSESN